MSENVTQQYVHKKTAQKVVAKRFLPKPLDLEWEGRAVNSDHVRDLKYILTDRNEACYEGDFIFMDPVTSSVRVMGYVQFLDTYTLVVPDLPQQTPVQRTGHYPDVDKLFTYHPPKGDQVIKYEQIRASGREFAKLIDQLCPQSADKSTAIRAVREAVMWANASIANE